MLKTRYTAEELMQMEPEALDELVERLVLGGRPDPEYVRVIHKSRSRAIGVPASRQEVPEYSSSYAALHLIMKTMESKGFSVQLGPDDSTWFRKDGKDYPQVPWCKYFPKLFAVAAILAVQGE